MGFAFVVAYIVIEIVVSLEIAAAIGTLATLGWLALGLVMGVAIIRIQGPLRMMQAAEAMRTGQAPQASLAAGVFSALAGVLLIVPGFFSDFLGLLLLIPVVQRFIVGRISKRIQVAGAASQASFYAHFSEAHRESAAGNVYDGEVVDARAPLGIDTRPDAAAKSGSGPDRD